MFLSKEYDFSELIENLIIIRDELMIEFCFFILTEEKGLTEQIKICKELEVKRYELIDSLKDIMVDIILESELHLKDKELDKVLERDIEYIPVDYLASKFEIEHKSHVLFKIYEIYPHLIDELRVRGLSHVYEYLTKILFETIRL